MHKQQTHAISHLSVFDLCGHINPALRRDELRRWRSVEEVVSLDLNVGLLHAIAEPLQVDVSLDDFMCLSVVKEKIATDSDMPLSRNW